MHKNTRIVVGIVSFKVSEYWGVGIMGCRNIGLSEYWDVTYKSTCNAYRFHHFSHWDTGATYDQVYCDALV